MLLLTLYGTQLKSFLHESSRLLGVKNYDLRVEVTCGSLLGVLAFLGYSTISQFKLLQDLAVYDRPSQLHRFVLVYNVLSVKYGTRLSIVLRVRDFDSVPSVSRIHPGAAWLEREVWDLFGLFFSGHAGLRRLLTDYGFEGHPLRKDFPLSGYVEVRYDVGKRRVLYEKIGLAQEYGAFKFISPWVA